MRKKKDEYEEIYGLDDDVYDPDEDEIEDDLEEYPIEFFDDPSYEEIYDENGEYSLVQCDSCQETIRWKNGDYICPNCGTVMNRSEFFNCIGAEPPGIECSTCNNLYPGCVICPYGYIKDN